jgi:hypothetical protein
MMFDKVHQLYKRIVKYMLNWIEILIKNELFFKLIVISERTSVAPAPPVKRRDRIFK